MEMDFHTLSRRELQALCKKNKIPANMTNLAMADALATLQQVEGLEEFLHTSQSDTEQLEEKDPCETPGIARAATRMSSRRKPTKEQQEPESSALLTHVRRSTRKVLSEKAADEGLNLLKTPAAPATRRKALAASAQRKAEIADQEGEKDKEANENAPVSEDAVVETRQKKPPVQKVYSARRSARLLERTMADLSLAEKKNIEPIRMDVLDLETAAKEVTEHAGEIKDADGVHAKTVSIHGWEKIDSGAPSDQIQTYVPEIEMQAEDGTEEIPGTDNSSKVSAGVGPTLSDSDLKDDEHEASPVVNNANETDADFEGEYVALTEGANPVEVPEQNVPSEAQNQLLVPSDTLATNVCEKSSTEADNHLGVHSDTSADEDSEENDPKERLLACWDVDEIHSRSQERVVEVVFENDLECGSEYATLEPPTDSTFAAALVPLDYTVSQSSAVSQLEMQVSPYAEKEIVGADVMDPSLTDIPVTTQTEESVYEAPTKVSLIELEEVAPADLERILPWTSTPGKVQVHADSEALGGVLDIARVEFAGKTDGSPHSLSTKTPTKRMHAFSPLMAGKSSIKKQQSTLKIMGSVLDENKENIIDSSTIRGEPDGERAKKTDANVDEDSMLKSLNDKSLRQLTRMLKEKLQLANKDSDEQRQTGKVRPALQELPDNRMEVWKKGEN